MEKTEHGSNSATIAQLEREGFELDKDFPKIEERYVYDSVAEGGNYEELRLAY